MDLTQREHEECPRGQCLHSPLKSKDAPKLQMLLKDCTCVHQGSNSWTHTDNKTFESCAPESPPNVSKYLILLSTQPSCLDRRAHRLSMNTTTSKGKTCLKQTHLQKPACSPNAWREKRLEHLLLSFKMPLLTSAMLTLPIRWTH